MSALSIKNRWLPADGGLPEVSATYARLQMFVNKINITEHRTGTGKPEGNLVLPAYYLAEWIAENWWVLLSEPRKDDQADDTEYLTRHSLVAAQGGFPLPNLSIVPTGRGIHLSCSPRIAAYANTKFTADVFTDASRLEVEKVLASFVDETVRRLGERAVANTSLVDVWSKLKSLTPEEREFCELLGSLGMSPDDASEALYSAIEKLNDALGFRALRDLCLAATPDDIPASVSHIEAVTQALAKGPDAALEPLLGVELPPENYGSPSWRRGRIAAERVRKHLGVDVKNANAADILFERMKVDPSIQTNISMNSSTPFSGAVAREDGHAKIALLQPDRLPRRFAAARVAYLAWVSESKSRRLVTNAVTRDQQASRSFAAEILVPQAYLRSLAGSKNELHPDQVREAARSRKVMPDVAFKQANNAGIRVHLL